LGATLYQAVQDKLVHGFLPLSSSASRASFNHPSAMRSQKFLSCSSLADAASCRASAASFRKMSPSNAMAGTVAWRAGVVVRGFGALSPPNRSCQRLETFARFKIH
jgi:hypothetical protein